MPVRAARRLVTLAAATLMALLLLAGTALAHHCYNPNKPAGAGVNYTVTGFGEDGPIFEQTGPGKGIGGFATVFGTDVHTIGNSGALDVVGNPDKTPESLHCDGRGIDYLGC